MIRSFAHKGLRDFFDSGTTKGINAQWARRLAARLTLLDAARTPQEMDVPGFGLHELKGERRGVWAVAVSGNWRLTFRMEEGDAHDVNLEDCH